MDQASSPISDVANFFEGRSILITGGTGFLGKVLIEKLLRSIPNIDKIYLVIRTQKNKNAQERWNSIVESTILFDHVRKLDENLIKKVVPMNGDILEDNLGLNPDDMKLICENVTIVFHCAATVRFDEPLKLAVRMNIEGTRKLLDICNKIKKLDVLVHTSTAYANCDRTSILEQVYKSDVPWRRLLDNLDWMSDEMFDQLTPYVLKGRPNTYTLTKAIAESMIVDDQESNQQLPVIMVRPSIVTGSWREPFPGWIDNWNGATGLIALGAKGLLRSICGDIERVRADLIPVDIVANALIVAAFHRGTTKGSPIFVVHCTTGQLNPTYWGQVVHTTIHNFKNKIPLVDLYRIPGGTVTPNKFEHRLRIIFDHLIPAYVIDFFSKVSGRRPFMVRTFEKLQKGLKTLEYFYTHQWNFETNAIIALNNQLSENDRKKFCIDVKQINWDTYYADYHSGVRKYIFKEDLSNLKLARKIQFRRQLITNFIMFGFLCILSYLLFRIFSA